MPTIIVNAVNNVLYYYEDTGAPPGVDEYHTVVVIHNFIFRGGTFCVR